ncbi:MAG: CoA transferase [Burkholderiaceae bacterium]|nr:CoA transferase [Burkholderiaceae bacterium]
MSTRLLDGIRVLDLSNVLAGPFCGYQLALLGADVIKVESPDGGDLARQLGADPALNAAGMGASFLAQNADKRSVVVDLKSEAGRATFLQLVDSADVLLENFRPGVMRRLGLDHETLRERRPALVYCAISGFGQTGPLSRSPAYDQIIQGRAGVMSVTGDRDSAPLRVGYPVCDTFGGLTAAFAICAALVQRARTGEGAFLDVSMLDSALVSMGWIVSNLLIAGQTPVPMGNDNFTASPSGTFATARGLLNIAANKQDQYEALCDTLGAPQLKTDPRFADRESRKRHRAELRTEIERHLAEADAATWEDQLNAVGVPAGQVLEVAQALSQEQLQARPLVGEVPLDLGGRGTLQLTGSAFLVDGQRCLPQAPPPRLGQHSAEILGELDAAQHCGGPHG